MTAKVARFRACWRVDLKIVFSLSRKLLQIFSRAGEVGWVRNTHLPDRNKNTILSVEVQLLAMQFFDSSTCLPGQM